MIEMLGSAAAQCLPCCGRLFILETLREANVNLNPTESTPVQKYPPKSYLTFDSERSRSLVSDSLGCDHAGIFKLTVLDNQLPLLALGNNLNPENDKYKE